MHRLINIDKEKYDNFVKNHKTKSHFLQSLSWGEFSKTKKGLKPYYLGLVDENEKLIIIEKIYLNIMIMIFAS